MSYCGYVTTIKQLRKHENADALQIATIFGNDVVVDMSCFIGQKGVYFPTDGQLSEAFCKSNNLLRIKNEDGTYSGGYLDPAKRNVKAIRLRGEKSDGIFLPITCLADFTTISELREGDQVTSYNGVEICKKYIPRRRVSGGIRVGAGHKQAKANYAPTFYEHVDTEQLAYNLTKFKHGDVVELTLKMHGTSGRTGYLPVRKQKARTILDKILRRPGKQYLEYDYVTGTRRVVLDGKRDGGYYEDNNFRIEMAKKFEGKLRKGETVYYEIVGFVNENTPIMASCPNSKVRDKEFAKKYGNTTVFSYGCDPNGDFEPLPAVDVNEISDTWQADPNDILKPRCNIYVYRMTMGNEDGDIVELSPEQMRLRCEQMGINTVPVFEQFMIPEMHDVETEYSEDDPRILVTRVECDPGEYVLTKVEEYFDGPDPIGKTHIREGVVARIVNRPVIAVFKHKNFNFKVLEGIIKDTADAPDMEEAQEVIDEG